MSGKLVALASYVNVPLAEVARLRLEQEGIPVHLENAETVTALWHVGNAVGYVRLMVPEEHVEQALALLDVDEAALRDDEQAESAPSEADICLACGAPMSDIEARCSACGWSYSESEEASAPAGAVAESELPAERSTYPTHPSPKTVSHVAGWRRITLQVWVSLIVGMFLLGLLACVLSLFR